MAGPIRYTNRRNRTRDYVLYLRSNGGGQTRGLVMTQLDAMRSARTPLLSDLHHLGPTPNGDALHRTLDTLGNKRLYDNSGRVLLLLTRVGKSLIEVSAIGHNRNAALAPLARRLHDGWECYAIKAGWILLVEKRIKRMPESLDTAGGLSIPKLVSDGSRNLGSDTGSAETIRHISSGIHSQFGGRDNAIYAEIAANTSDLINLSHRYVMEDINSISGKSTVRPSEAMALYPELTTPFCVGSS